MNVFEGCEKSLRSSDIAEAEQEIGRELPNAFRRHYLQYNGGTPSLSYVPGDSAWEPVEIATFFPIKFNEVEGNLKRTLVEGKYRYMVEKGVVPNGLLPFAGDHGGNFFCLELSTGAVYFFATDSFDPDSTSSENQKRAMRLLAHSFDEFLKMLTDEDGAFEAD